MSWINAGQFQIADRNGRHYVFRRNNSGNTEINIPASIVTKAQAKRWLKNNPNKVRAPTKFRPKRPAPKPFVPINLLGLGRKRQSPWRPVVPGVPYSPRNWSPNFSYGNNVTAAYPAISPPWVPPPPSPNAPERVKWSSMTCDKIKASLKKLKAIGSGRQGKVYLASQMTMARKPFIIKVCPRDLAAARRKEPQPADVEFKIQKAAAKAAPDGVVQVFDIVRCLDFVKPAELNGANFTQPGQYDRSKQGLIFMEYCSGGSFREWFKTTKQTNDEMARNLVSQILTTIGQIQRKYPQFRHNDLHLDNIFVSGRGFLIGDFGWARLERMGTNPAVNTANSSGTAAHWGVGPSTDPRYDHHMFLNELLVLLKRSAPAKYPRTIAFLERVVPSGYRGATDTHVSEWRLKYRDPCPGLPSLDKVLRDPFLRPVKRVRSPQLAAARAKLRKVRQSPPKRKKLTTSPELAAAKAKLRPARPKKRVTSPELAAARAKLKKAGRPKKRVTSPELVAARAKLRKAPAKNKKPANETKRVAARAGAGLVLPNRKRKAIPPALLKSAKFNRLVAKIYSSQGGPANESFQNAWNRARTKAINQVQNRLNKNQAPFTPSPPKARANLPPPLSPLGPPPKPKPKARNFNYKLSPSSGRAKIRAPNSGRYVYANGSTISMEYLKGVAARLGVNIKGLRSKANIAKKIFG